MWLKMMRSREAPASSAAVMKSSSRSARNRPRTTRASSVQPISEMMMRDGEIDLLRRPACRHRRGQAHPQRDGRDRAQDLDHALDHHVDPAALQPGDAAEQHAEHQAQSPRRPARWSATSASPAPGARTRRARAGRCRAGTARPAACRRETPDRWMSVGIRPNRLYG